MENLLYPPTTPEEDDNKVTDEIDEINYMSVEEFRAKGYLQELNRRFLHPLGLALSVTIDNDGSERLGPIWDYREDSEGLAFGLANSDEERITRFKRNAGFIDSEIAKHVEVREGLFGGVIEPIE